MHCRTACKPKAISHVHQPPRQHRARHQNNRVSLKTTSRKIHSKPSNQHKSHKHSQTTQAQHKSQFSTASPLQFSPSTFFAHVDRYEYDETLRFTHPDGLIVLARALSQISSHPQHQVNILLYGDLGTGKTTFTRAFIRHLTASPALQVVSPTFTIQQLYTHNHRNINHMDLYRLHTSDEAHILGLLETYNDSFDENSHQPTNPDHNTTSITNITADDLIHYSNLNNGLQQSTYHNFSLPSPTAPINIIEWPHVLHQSKYLPKSYIRIHIEDCVTYKQVHIGFVGGKYAKEMGQSLMQYLLQSVQDYNLSKEAVNALTTPICFADDALPVHDDEQNSSHDIHDESSTIDHHSTWNSHPSAPLFFHGSHT